jgi:hypothetical protein
LKGYLYDKELVELWNELFLQLSELSGGSLGYGFSRIIGKLKPQTESPVKGRSDDATEAQAGTVVVP